MTRIERSLMAALYALNDVQDASVDSNDDLFERTNELRKVIIQELENRRRKWYGGQN